MTTFDDRERSFEKKFVMDQELKFKAEARRNRLVGQWLGGDRPSQTTRLPLFRARITGRG